jgi:hypothetical protein
VFDETLFYDPNLWGEYLSVSFVMGEVITTIERDRYNLFEALATTGGFASTLSLVFIALVSSTQRSLFF